MGDWMGMSPMVAEGRFGTVVYVSLRTAIRDMLLGTDADGLVGVPADDVAQALTSYADTATLAEADALAPIVTRASHVPFDEAVDGAIGEPLDDVHAELVALGPIDTFDTVDTVDDVDPAAGFDEVSSVKDDLTDDRTADPADVEVPDVDPADAEAGKGEADGAFRLDDDAADDAAAFGTGDRTAAREASASETPVAHDDGIEPFDAFAGVDNNLGMEFDAINDAPFSNEAFESDVVEPDEFSDADDGALDDSFGDVDFDV